MHESSLSNSRKTVFFVITCSIFVLSFSLSPPFLNMFVNYTLPGGGVFEKIHPATYLVFGAFIWMSTYGIPKYENNRINYNIAIALLLLLAHAALIGNFSYMAVIIDIFFAPSIFVILLRKLDIHSQVQILKLFLAISVLNTILVAVELVSQQSLLVYEQELSYFRPAGLFGHPIATGAISCIAMLSCRKIIENSFNRRTILAILLCQVSMCGVRAALITAVAIFVSDIFAETKRTLRTVVYDVVLILALITIVLIFQNLGVFDRILARGVWDNSAASRVDIFNIFSVMSDDEFWLGTSSERILMYAQSLNQSRIENSFVVAVYQFGLLSSIALFATIAIYFVRAAIKSVNFLILLIFIAFGTIYFGVKSPVNWPLFLLAQIISTTGSGRRLKSTAIAGNSPMASEV